MRFDFSSRLLNKLQPLAPSKRSHKKQGGTLSNLILESVPKRVKQ